MAIIHQKVGNFSVTLAPPPTSQPSLNLASIASLGQGYYCICLAYNPPEHQYNPPEHQYNPPEHQYNPPEHQYNPPEHPALNILG